jgi:hypothetical protein
MRASASRRWWASSLRGRPLAHAVGDKAEQAYRRGDALEKRRRLMDAWTAYCEQKPAADNVLPITTRRYAGTVDAWNLLIEAKYA